MTDEPRRTGAAFGRRVLEDWQLLHGRLPPLLNKYLLSDEGDYFVRLAALLLWLRRNAQGPWRLYVDMLPKVGVQRGGGRQRGGTGGGAPAAAALPRPRRKRLRRRSLG